jgi:malonyl-CoA O-methyltransferase
MILDAKLKYLMGKILQRGRCRSQDFRCLFIRMFRMDRARELQDLSPASRALEWIRAHELPTGGIRVHSRHACASPEATGYLIPTLLQYGERELTLRLVRWLLCIQRADGSYPGPDDGKSYVFDTGQVLRGLLAAIEIEPRAKDAAMRAADYLCREMHDQGRGGFGNRYGGIIPESVHLYVLPPLLQAAEVFQNPRYREMAENCMAYYLSHPDFLRVDDLTHFLAYQLEALIDLGRADLAIPVLDELEKQQKSDGSVRGVGGAKWVCAPGLAQLAICWYKIGRWEPADKALAWLERHQRPSGGFLGSYGPGASYFPSVEIPWAAKYYLDAHRLRVLSFMERNANIFPSEVSLEDGRLQAILAVIRPGDRVVEVGCGKGRFLKAIRQVYPDTQCTGVDISPALLAHLPPDIERLEGALECVPCPDDSFDVVFSVEAIEHSANVEAAVRELIRIARPGGWVIIVDKQQSAWGRLACPPWERWPDADYLARLLRRGCDNVSYQAVSYDGHPADGLMLVWRGQKRSRLTGSEWHEVLISPSSQQAVVERVRHGRLSEWAQLILLETSPGEKVLEIGSVTGEISLHLAQAGREVTALDYSAESLAFIQRCAADLGVTIKTVQADASQPLPFTDDQFDCVWSSGLLEHFTPDERRKMLREWARITRGKVIALVPNAACVAYRAGKAYQEEQGIWPYGLEMPILSLRDDFKAAGLHVVSEYSVGAKHALSFLPPQHPLRKSLFAWMESMSPEELRDCNQGYLLVTIGTKYHEGYKC